MGISYIFLSMSFVCIFLTIDFYFKKQFEPIGKTVFLSLIFNVIAMITSVSHHCSTRAAEAAHKVGNGLTDTPSVEADTHRGGNGLQSISEADARLEREIAMEKTHAEIMYNLGYIKAQLDHMTRDLKDVTSVIGDEIPADQDSSDSDAASDAASDAGVTETPK
jgi:hypothetical protein